MNASENLRTLEHSPADLGSRTWMKCYKVTILRA